MKPLDIQSDRPAIALSIVSHAQGALVGRLLDDLNRIVDGSTEVVLTLNVPESEGFIDKARFPLRVIRNPRPLGFGSNHNRAHRTTYAEYFAVLNPDLRLPQPELLRLLLEAFANSSVGAAAPLVLEPTGRIEDHARRFPSPSRITRRLLHRTCGTATASDYDLLAVPLTAVDWAAGMFVVFRSDLYRRLGGFDEGYFMYLEDADICRRLASAGYGTVVCRDAKVIHDARRATLRHWRHLRWHLTSMARFFAKSLVLRLQGERAPLALPPEPK